MWGIIFGGIQHSPVNDCSGACWNFEVLALEDELTSFYSAILITQYLGAVSKITEWSLFISKPNQSVSVIRVYTLTKNTKEAEAEWFYDDLKDLLELTPKKEKRERERCPFHHRGLECKSRKSTDTWSNRQVWPWSTKWSGAKKSFAKRMHLS